MLCYAVVYGHCAGKSRDGDGDVDVDSVIRNGDLNKMLGLYGVIGLGCEGRE